MQFFTKPINLYWCLLKKKCCKIEVQTFLLIQSDFTLQNEHSKEDHHPERRHHEAEGGRHRQRRQLLVAGGRGSGRVHPQGRGEIPAPRMQDLGRVQDRAVKNHHGTQPSRQARHSHRGTQRGASGGTFQLLQDQPGLDEGE